MLFLSESHENCNMLIRIWNSDFICFMGLVIKRRNWFRQLSMQPFVSCSSEENVALSFSWRVCFRALLCLPPIMRFFFRNERLMIKNCSCANDSLTNEYISVNHLVLPLRHVQSLLPREVSLSDFATDRFFDETENTDI